MSHIIDQDVSRVSQTLLVPYLHSSCFIEIDLLFILHVGIHQHHSRFSCIYVDWSHWL